ncbi:hypothetical protein [Nocardioides sp.]|uniref:hypothetical protein n=1 Tax=Nocardioides sp. TaxID=35761 RepID=UPI002ED81314
MTRLLRLLLAALLLAGGAVAAIDAPALACPGGKATLGQQTKRADDVFVGTVEERTERARTVEYAVRVERIYKGDLDTTDATVTTLARARACGLPDLRPDTSYVFMTAGADLEITSTGGTSPASTSRVARVERLLGSGRAAEPPAPVEATFTTVGEAPTSFERVAAPGAALVLVGLLGLLLVAGLGRRRA